MPAFRSVLRTLVVLGLAALPAALIAPAVEATQTFSNPAPITINDSPFGGATATPYPSSLSVAGIGLVADVDVFLTGFGHTFPDDVDVLLVSPSGQKAMIMSDTGGNSPVSGINITLSDEASTPLPDSLALSSGTFAPADYIANDLMPSPAPPGPFGSALSAFDGIDPNGTWSLYVVDDLGGDSGTISGGWGLVFNAPYVKINDSTITEGDSGTLTMNFSVTLLAGGGQPASVNFSTSSDTATTADYQPVSGTVGFSSSAATKTISVPIKGDLLDEVDETFLVVLSSPSNVTIQDGVGVGTILDNDPTPVIYVSDASLTEPDSGSAGMVFTLSLTNPSSSYVTVDFDTDNGTATAGSDYKARSGTRIFSPGQTNKTITIPIIGETAQEPDETFSLKLYDPDNALVGPPGYGVGTIVDNDRPVINVSDASVTEANGTTTKTMTFTATLTHAGTSTVTVHYATVAGSATAPADYTAKSGTLTFTAGQVSKTVVITIKGDNLVEGNETFTLVLDTPTGATIGDGTGVGTIIDND